MKTYTKLALLTATALTIALLPTHALAQSSTAAQPVVYTQLSVNDSSLTDARPFRDIHEEKYITLNDVREQRSVVQANMIMVITITPVKYDFSQETLRQSINDAEDADKSIDAMYQARNLEHKIEQNQWKARQQYSEEATGIRLSIARLNYYDTFFD